MYIPRYLQEPISLDLKEKMVFVSGPRQVGKTTLAKTFVRTREDLYYNWDNREDRRKILSARWPATPATVVLDELHKYRHWKSWIKGEYNLHGERISFLITGSARLDIYRKGGDSLQGRYHAYRLHGFSVGELQNSSVRSIQPLEPIEFPTKYDDETILSLFEFGSFPEPFLKQDKRSLRRWQKERLDRFFREDVRELEAIRDLSLIELLAEMLVEKVGSPLSVQSLREDLEVSHKAASHWIEILERLYYCFRIFPFTHKAVRSLKKTPKIYLWDRSSIPDPGARFENMVACHLLKLKHFLEDYEGYEIGLHYLRDVSKREVDFLLTLGLEPWFAVECKLGQGIANASLKYFGERLEIPHLFQINLHGKRDILEGKVRLMQAAKFFAAFI